MAFSDLPFIGKCFQHIPTHLLNSTERATILLIASHKNGCYIGYLALAQQVGTTPRNLLKVLSGLGEKDIIKRAEQFAYKGRQQRYSIDLLSLRKLADIESLSVKTPLEPVATDTEPVATDTEPVAGVLEACPVRHPYKEYKNNKNDKDERFSFITKDLPEGVKALIEYAPNVSKLLDELIHQGISLDQIKGALDDTDFTNAYKVGGLFMSVLSGLRASLAPIPEKPIEVYEPRNCDMCKDKCASGNDLEQFLAGARCYLETPAEYRSARQRSGLAP